MESNRIYDIFKQTVTSKDPNVFETEEERRRRLEKEKLEQMQQTVQETPIEVFKEEATIPTVSVKEEPLSPEIIPQTKEQQIKDVNPIYAAFKKSIAIDTSDDDRIVIDNTTPTSIEPTSAEKFELGTRLETWTAGNIFRLIKAGGLTLSNNKSYQQNVEDLAKERVDKVYDLMKTKYGKEFTKFSRDAEVIAGSVSTALVDPVTFLIPWAKIAKVGKAGATGIGAGIGGIDISIYEYANHGEVSPSNVFFAAGLGGLSTLGGTVLANKMYGPRDKNINLGKVDDSGEDVIVQSSAKDTQAPKLTNKEVEQLASVVPEISADVAPILKQLESSTYLNQIVKKYQIDVDNFNNAKKLLADVVDEDGYRVMSQLDVVVKGTKVSKAEQYKLAGISAQKFSNLKKKDKEATDFLKNKLPNLMRQMADGQVELVEATLKGLRRNKIPISESMLLNVMDGFVRPLFGGGLGYSIGTFVGDQDDNTSQYSFMAAGLALGGMSRMIEKTPYLNKDSKEKAFKFLNNSAAVGLHNFLKVWTSGNITTRNIAHGGPNETFARTLFTVLDGRKKSIISAEQATDSYNVWFSGRIAKVLKNANENEMNAAFKIVRQLDTEKNLIKEFNLTPENIKNVRQLVANVEVFKSDVVKYAKQAGIDFEEIANYGLPQIYSREIMSNPTGFKKAIRQALKVEKPKLKGNKLKAQVEEIYENMAGQSQKTLFDIEGAQPVFKGVPYLKNFERERFFKDPKAIKILEPYLETNLVQVLDKWVSNTTRGVEFARKFGQRGDRMKVFFQDLYKQKELGKISEKAYKEKRKLIIDSTNAYFGVHGATSPVTDMSKNSMALLTFLANTTFLPRAVISQLGDLVQPFTNSSVGSASTALLSRWRGDRDFAKKLGIATDRTSMKSKEIDALLASGNHPTTNFEQGIVDATQKFFRYNGMIPLTDAAARWAFNTGIEDGFKLAKRYATSKKVSKAVANQLNSKGLTKKELTYLNKFDKITDAFDDSIGQSILVKSGNKTMNRDVLVPTAGNRMLFNQSKNPYVKSMGLFLSWAQAKSAQMNTLIRRVEDGDMKLAIKLLGSTAIYGGIRELQIMASPAQEYYEKNAPDRFSEKWWAEAVNLSGATDWRAEKFLRTFQYWTGSGGKSPIVNLSPILSQVDSLTKVPMKVTKNLEASDYEGAVVSVLKPTPAREFINVYNRLIIPVVNDTEYGIHLEELTDEPNIVRRTEFQKLRRPFDEGGEVQDEYPVPFVKKDPKDRESDDLFGASYQEQMSRLGFDKGGNMNKMKRVAASAGLFASLFGGNVEANQEMSTKVLGAIKNERGYTEEEIKVLKEHANQVGFMESDNIPDRKQIDGGPGRGKYQYEIKGSIDGSGANQTAVTRYKNFLKRHNIKPTERDVEIISSKNLDFSTLSEDEQDAIFYADKAMGMLPIDNLVRGRLSQAEAWVDYHHAGKKEDREKMLEKFVKKNFKD